MFKLTDEAKIDLLFRLAKKVEPEIDYDYIMEGPKSYVLYRKMNKKKGFHNIVTGIIEKDLLN